MARFSLLRTFVSYSKRFVENIKKGKEEKPKKIDYNYKNDCFRDVDVDSIVASLEKDGVAFGLKLPDSAVKSIMEFSEKALCYADRDPRLGFDIRRREAAEQAIGKKILVAQYYNTMSECAEVERLANNPTLNEIARRYLKSSPSFVGANLWWTFPVNASDEERSRHAHFFHRDVDDFKFFKFFFYLTDVASEDGAHVCVVGSQGKPPVRHPFDRWNIRRYTDDEINQKYASSQIKEIVGQAGDGFAEDTWCIHKGQTPKKEPRLLLQLQFALFDYGAMHDQRDKHLLKTCHDNSI
ncbi:phytanoyl-CoA dioxygenase family protein [Halomonas salifodinae]|uniref:Phytanoyl-CoA dioxygenase family protein n=1 Tax=Halomonas salifodinae TaxID=438745 RepID=A0ABW2EWX4_9GAMM